MGERCSIKLRRRDMSPAYLMMVPDRQKLPRFGGTRRGWSPATKRWCQRACRLAVVRRRTPLKLEARSSSQELERAAEIQLPETRSVNLGLFSCVNGRTNTGNKLDELPKSGHGTERPRSAVITTAPWNALGTAVSNPVDLPDEATASEDPPRICSGTWTGLGRFAISLGPRAGSQGENPLLI